jgi:hypothetical protein
MGLDEPTKIMRLRGSTEETKGTKEQKQESHVLKRINGFRLLDESSFLGGFDFV